MKLKLRSLPFSFESFVLSCVVGVSALGLVSCKKPAEEESVARARPVKVLKVSDAGAVKEVEYPGQIRAVQKSWMAFEVPGRVIKRFVKEGEVVKKGQVLAQLDSRDYQFAYDSAKAQHEATLAVKERKEQLLKKGAVSRQELDLAKRDLRQATAKLKQAEKALSDTKLIADFDGRVAKLLVEDFTNVVAKENVLMLQNNALLEVVINLPESSIGMPLAGKTVEEKVNSTHPRVLFSALPGEEYPAVYREASEHPDPVTRTYELKLTFLPELGSMVRPGMTAKVRASIPMSVANRAKGFLVPVHALVSENDKTTFVWRIDPEKMTVSKVVVTLGIPVGQSCMVQGELKNGDLIVVAGVHELREGDKVRIWKPESLEK
jgi:RND family efflux transporter MFP subunit